MSHRNLTYDTKEEVLRFLLAMYTPLSDRKPAPIVVCNKKATLAFLPPRHLLYLDGVVPLNNVLWALGVCSGLQ